MSIILRVGAVKSSRVHETHYGSGDEASSYTDADVLDIPLPEHTYQRPHPPPSTQTQCSTGYFGLPYQDHNYGMPPPPSPSRPVSPRPPSPLQVNGVVQMEEEVKTTPFVSVVEEVVEDSITRCICGYLHDDGYMICCDRCSVWQHIDCMGVDRNNIPESYFCELCQPRTLDAQKAKMLQKKKREELAARNVLSDSSATDTDPEEASNALASMGKKPPTCKKKSLKQKRSPKAKDKQTPLKLKIGKGLAQKKMKKPGKKEKENIKTAKPKKLFKTGSQKLKPGTSKMRPLLTLEQLSADPWNSNLSPWVDSYEFAHENHYSPAVREFSYNTHLIGQAVDVSSIVSDQLLTQVTCVADVKKNRKGLRATQEIPAGHAIIEYRGKVLLRHDYDKEYAFVNSFKKLQPFVLFYSQLDVDLCVDARVYGNEARFVRRSCSPNSEVQHILSQGKVYFLIVSKKNIQAGSEITIPFDYNYENCSYFVECACVKSNCVVSKYWKRSRNARKSSAVDIGMKRRRQTSIREASKVGLDDRFNSSTSQASPTKASTSPVKSLQMKLTTSASPHPPVSSPVKFSNVCTLLAASALLDGQPDLVSSLKLDTPESLPQAPAPPPTPPLLPPKSAASSRRGSRQSEDCTKEDKPVVVPAPLTKDKHKTKELKPKEKDVKDHAHAEVKKERRPSSRRQSQEDMENMIEVKTEVSSSAAVESDDTSSTSDCPRKLTREERKLDAIMKAFEKMEKREERRKEAMARGDAGPKKCSGDAKVKKKDEPDSSGGCGSSVNPCTTPQDGPVVGEEAVKTEVAAPVDEPEIKSPSVVGDIKPETASVASVPDTAGTLSVGTACVPAVSAVVVEAQATVKEESPQKSLRKTGKRKRRRSRVQSTTALSDAASVSTDEGNSNSSFPVGPVSVPATPALTPVSTPLPHADLDAGLFKYIKTKKHLFEEWSSKQEDETSKHEGEMFVEYLPNPHVNTMDHLQRRHSHGAGCSTRGSESSVGSAKKRWLRQAMHDVPAPVAFNHSLSVSTDNGGGSPVHGGASPNPGTACMGSPVSASPLDFVTPLKKRRLMRESVSNENNGPRASVSSIMMSESNVGITPKTNGVKQFFPVHRHSTDDRLLLHKDYPHQNGYREAVSLTNSRKLGTTAASTHACLSSSPTHSHINDLDVPSNGPEQRSELLPHPMTDPVQVPASFPHVGAMSEAVPASLTQSSSQYALKLRGIFARMEVNSSDETFKGNEIQPAASSSSSRLEESDVCVTRSSLHGYEDDNRIDSSASVTTVVVVNSRVYSGVNSLMDEGSEAGCVTAKSIMDIDSPATVCVDLNAHEMEPSLSDGSAVVSLDDRLFNRSGRDVRTFEVPSECQVNSSEDVVETLPLMSAARASEICDNVCTGSTSRHFQHVGFRNHSVTFDNDNEKEREVVDSSQHVHRNGVGEFAAVFEERDGALDQPGTSSSVKIYTECISSSATESTLEGSNVVCDSIEEASESGSELCGVVGQRDTDVEQVQALGPDFDESNTDNDEVRTCDSVGGNVPLQQLSMCRVSVGNNYEEEVGESAVSESHYPDQPFFVSGSDGGVVDSTSSELNRASMQHLVYVSAVNSELPEAETIASEGCCDSNYERLPNGDNVYDSSVTGDESSLEGLCVSSSSVTDLQNGSTWESFSPEAVSATACPDHISAHSQTTPSTAEASGACQTPALQQVDCSLEVGTSATTLEGSRAFVNSNISCSSQSCPSRSLVLSPTSLSVISTESILSSTFPGPSCAQLAMTSSSTAASQTATISPPILSTTEATPAGRKKVSLLEYRKRLKDKPALPGASEVKTSSIVPASSSSTPHKLSPTLSMFLASSPTSSASSTSPSKSPSSSHHQKKLGLPTLATLPLFKDADSKRDDGKRKHRAKHEKQLSLTDRLRLEFGLEDCGEDASSKKKDDSKKHRGRTSPPSPPPPPPPHPPPLLPSGTTSPYQHHHHQHTVSRHNAKDGEEPEVASSNEGVEEAVPPPPPPLPPSAGSAYPALAATASFATPSAHPQTGFHGSQSPLVNGGPGSYYSYQQQPCISSTTLSTPPPSHANGGRDRQVPRFSAHSGASAAPYQPHSQQLPSATHLNTPPQAWAVNQGSLPPPLSSTNIHHIHPPPTQQYHWQPSQPQTVTGENISEDHPPPPPPPPPRPHHRHSLVSSSSSSSSSQNRHHHHHSSSGKSSKAASSSSSHYSENRSRH